MALIPSNLRLFILLHKRLGFKAPVLTLGNQDILATYDDLKAFFEEQGCPYEEPSTITPSVRHRQEGFVHAKVFFEMMGIRDYLDVDKFDEDDPMLLHDMNLPVPAELKDRFSLVVDSGTIEHIFDVRQVMSNMTRMTRVGGCVVHFSPSSNYIDHGFYSFSPCFFFDFYEQNGFDECSCYILQVNERNLLEPCSYFEYSYGMPLVGSPLIDPSKVIVTVFVARKSESVAEIQIPVQGIYDKNRANKPAATAEVQEVHDSLYESYVPGFLRSLLGPVRPLLGRARRVVTPEYKLLKKI